MSFNKFKLIRGKEVLRHLKVDLWGKLLTTTTKSSSRLFRQFYKKRRGRRHRQFVMRIDINNPRKPRKFLSMYGLGMVDKQKFRHYWGNISENKFRHLFRTAHRKAVPKFEAFIEKMETTLIGVVLRSGFFDSVFHIKQLIAHGHVYVNGVVVREYYSRLNVGDYLSFSDVIKQALRKRPIRLFLNKLAIPPSYLIISYKIFTVLLADWPRTYSVYYPFKYDATKLLNFYKV